MANTIIAVDSMTKLPDAIVGRVLVSGSHGGLYPAYLAAKSQVRGIILNDAGGGKDDAGFASLDYLQTLGIPAATCGHLSARIGDGEDMLMRGKISRVNRVATRVGCSVDQDVGQAAELMNSADWVEVEAPVYEESRFCLSMSDGDPMVWGIDSASLVRPEDEGQIIVTGSHGGLLGGDIAAAIRVPAAACAFNDAGVGADGVGITRLAALDTRGIAAVTVDCMSACIGDARSMWDSGEISYVNEKAKACGINPGQTLQTFSALMRQVIKKRSAGVVKI